MCDCEQVKVLENGKTLCLPCARNSTSDIYLTKIRILRDIYKNVQNTIILDMSKLEITQTIIINTRDKQIVVYFYNEVF